MKLARPDIFNPRIVLAGSPAQPTGAPDDDGLVAALGRRGLHAHWLSWDDPAVSRADLVILRGGAAGRRAEFLAWAASVSYLLPAPEVIAWNLGADHLADLAGRGVPTVSTAATGPTAPTALVFLGGRASHAFTAAGAVEPDFEIWDAGLAALDAAAQHLGVSTAEFLVARAEVAGPITDPRLVRLQLVDPELGWHTLDVADRGRRQRQFALEVESALQRRDLGPLSQRRP